MRLSRLIKCHAELVSASCQHRVSDRSRNKFGMTILFLFVFCFLGCESTLGAVAPAKPVLPAVVKPKTAQIAQTVPPVVPQPVDFSNCSKFFKLDSQKLFNLSLAAVNANRFSIDEIQSRSGYVLFTAAQRQFLLSVISIDSQTSMLKITPSNNVYYFPVGIVQNMFKYVELNINTPIEKLGVM